MDWDKAKNIVIIMLLILNTALFGFNFAQNQKYQLSYSQEKAILDVLSKNGISMYTDIIQKAYPMRQVSVEIPSLSIDLLKKIYFDDGEDVKITVEFNKTILKTNDKVLSLENNLVIYESMNEDKKIDNFNQESAIDFANDFVEKLSNISGSLNFDNVSRNDDGTYTIEYLRSFKGNKLFNTLCEVYVSENGVFKMEAGFYGEESFVGIKRQICMPDEALLTFLQNIEKEENRGIFINKMELGYDFEEKLEIAEGRVLKLVPCYRIYTSDRSEPYIINAYTNELKNN